VIWLYFMKVISFLNFIGDSNLPGLDAVQSHNARKIFIAVNSVGVGTHGCEVAITAGLTESNLNNLANNNVPESLKYAHDGLGSDHDRIGIFQFRAAIHKDIKADMNPTAAAKIFFKELKRVKNWENIDVGTAAQKTQRSSSSSYQKQTSKAVEVCAAIA